MRRPRAVRKSIRGTDETTESSKKVNGRTVDNAGSFIGNADWLLGGREKLIIIVLSIGLLFYWHFNRRRLRNILVNILCVSYFFLY